MKKELKNFLKNPWTRIVGIITAVSFLFTIGYNIGLFKGEIDCNLEQTRTISEYQNKILEVSKEKKECQINSNSEKIKELELFVNSINQSDVKK